MRDNKTPAYRAYILHPLFAELDSKCVNRTKLAKKFGISRALLCHYEKGRVQVPGKFIDWMIKELQLDPNIIDKDARALVERKQLKKGA
jgi:transcriptional regulator with XRE-family HTH domain